MIKIIIKFFKNGVIGSNRGISIILAIIVIIMLGLAGSIFAYLTASGSITSRSNLVSAAAKYAAKSGVEITLYELKTNPPPSTYFSGYQSGCPPTPVSPPGVSGTPTNIHYLSANSSGNSLQGILPKSVEYTPTFCAVEGALGSCGGGGYTSYVITSNGFAGGTQREVTAEAGIPIAPGKNGVICAETELPNG